MPLSLAEQERLKGCVARKNLTHGAYYEGKCRNAKIARWNAELGLFFYNRTKFSRIFVESIKHPEDESPFDLFWPAKEISVEEKDKVPLGWEEKESNK